MQVADNADRPRRRARRPLARRRADRRAPRRQPGVRRQRRASSARCSPRPRPPRRSSTRRPPASSTARSRSRAAPATSTAARSPAPTATSRPARFMHPLGANRAYDYLGHVALGEQRRCTEMGARSPSQPRAGAGRALVPRRARPVRDRRRVRHRGAGRRARRADRQLARLRLARPAAGLVLPVAQLAHVVADAAGGTLRRQRAGPTARARSRPRATPAGADRFAGLDWEPGPAACRCSPTPSPRSSARSSPSTPPAITGSSSAASTTSASSPVTDPLVFFAGVDDPMHPQTQA